MEQFGDIKLYNCDCMELMAKTPDKYYSLALVDPPYKSKAGMPIPYRGGMKALFVLLVCNVSFYCFFRDMSDALAIIITRPQCREAAP